MRARDLSIVDDDHGISRRILNDVEGYVAEVPFVADAVAAAERGFSITEYINRKSDARRYGPVLRSPQASDRTRWTGKYLPGTNALDVTARAIVEVGIHVPVVIVLNAIILIPKSVV